VSNPPAAAVSVQGLVKRYGAVRAVDGVSFALPQGAISAVLGPNGAGKTTTLEVCEGYRRRDAGDVRILGLDPERDGAALRPRVGVMPQGGTAAVGAYVGARVGEVMRLFAAHYADPAPIGPLLDSVGLADALRRPYRGLSGGQQQRLSFALALVGRPHLVFLDEPTAGLDVAARRDLWDVIRGLRDAGTSVVVTTHLLDEAERLADHVVVLAAGRVVAAGSPAQVRAAGDTAGSVRWRAAAGLPLTSLAARLGSAWRVAEPAPGSYEVTPRAGGAPAGDAALAGVLAAVTAWAAGQGLLVDELTAGGGSFEERYLALTAPTATPAADRPETTP
jgi:ABC-2 type transport system ATP-binding protein